MTRDDFYRQLLDLIQDARPGLDVTTVTPATHLWQENVIDSVTMMEIVAWLEETLDRDLDLTSDFLANFSTMATVYDAYVA